MAIDITTCAIDELPDLVASLDREFITGRGRIISLAQRFPGLLDPQNLGHILVGREQGRVVCSLAVKRFDWITGEREYAGAMIGSVWVAPANRGRGLGVALLAQANSALARNADFAVLWTAQPCFYARAGWTAADDASFGEIGGSNTGVHGNAVDLAAARAIWQERMPCTIRGAGWRPPLPLPAESLEMFGEDGAYAIAGRAADRLYCYEMLGDAGKFGAILDRMRAACATLYVNERSGSAAHVALQALGVRWQNKSLAMWLPLRQNVLAQARGWYIPWLDRI